ncbi:uncharacterized protein MKZ38_002592 [Zalerion maritima]|uniref:DUF6594 domain-containing protein n=1 Tax=Zalerion maritima TaxID=339359 RepID=A0AAD5RNP1_9PEZI|nr:uncharacterized protein MKZ38_002592 [Zalerion maritima]
MSASHLPPTVETLPPTPNLAQDSEFPRDTRRSENGFRKQQGRKQRSSVSHRPSFSTPSNSTSDNKSRHPDSMTSKRMSAFGSGPSVALAGPSSSQAAPRRHSVQAAAPHGTFSLHEGPIEIPGAGHDNEEMDIGVETPVFLTPEHVFAEHSGFLPPPPDASSDHAFLPQPERGRNRRPKPKSASPPIPAPRRRTTPEKDLEDTKAQDMQMVHHKPKWEHEAKQNSITSPTTDSTGSHNGHSPRSDASSHEQGEHETDRSSSPEHTTSYEEEKAKLEEQLKAAQAAQARSMAAGGGTGTSGERLSVGVGGTMPAGGMGLGNIIGGGYPYQFSLPGQMPPNGQPGHHPHHMQPPQSPHFQLQPPPFSQLQMGRPQSHYDPSGRQIPPTPMSDPQAYINNPMPPPQHQRGSSYSGTPQREYGPGGPGPSLGTDSRERERQYGTPEMPRGNAVLPHIPPGALTPRPVTNPQVKHLPRGERLPLTGYELLSNQLANRRRRESTSSTASGKPHSLPPVYKRFTTLNHRLLLTLQDEISELEEQLHRLDTNDTQVRRVPGGQILPASRRQDASTPNELQWTRSNLINRIAEKVGVYNHILSTFQKTQGLPAPSTNDVTFYRNYLNEKLPIADNEARFLDAEWDLISLADQPPADDGDEWPSSAPQPPLSRRSSLVSQRRGSEASALTRPSALRQKKSVEFQRFPKMVPILAAAVALAVLFPILTFLVIPVFVGRMMVVFLVAGGVSAGLTRGGIVGEMDSVDMMVVAAVYGAVMSVVAGVVA